MGVNGRRGVDVLKSLPQNKVIWNPTGCISGQIEFGSTSPVAWVREDLMLFKVALMNLASTGCITLAKGGTPLRLCLEDTVSGASILKGQKKALFDLFTSEQLRMPAGNVNLPPWDKLEKALVTMGIQQRQTYKIAQMAYRNASRRGCSWAAYVKEYRIGVMQELGGLGILPNAENLLTCSFIEDILLASGFGELPITLPVEWQQGKITNPGGLCEQMGKALDIIFGGPGVRVFNFPCQNHKNPCDDWHFVDVHGRQRGFGKTGNDIPKRCRIKNLKRFTLSDVFALGGNVSGAALYYLWGQMGKSGNLFPFLAADYSRGEVYKILESAFRDPMNGSRAVPVGAFYLYGKGTDPKKSIDSLVFFDVLLRSRNPGDTMNKIMQSIPIPYQGAWEILVEIDTDGNVTVIRKGV